MYKVINEYMSKVKLQSNGEIHNMLVGVLTNIDCIKKFSVSVHFHQYVIDIKLKDYSVQRAGEVFELLHAQIAYQHSCLYVRFNEGKCVRYRFLTSKEDKEAIYCDFIFS